MDLKVEPKVKRVKLGTPVPDQSTKFANVFQSILNDTPSLRKEVGTEKRKGKREEKENVEKLQNPLQIREAETIQSDSINKSVELQAKVRGSRKRGYGRSEVSNNTDVGNLLSGEMPPHPLINDLILSLVMRYTSCSDLIKCRLVSTCWNYAATAQLKKRKAIRLNARLPFVNSPFERNSLSMYLSDMSGGNDNGMLFPARNFSIKLTMTLEEAAETHSKPLHMDSKFVTTQFEFITSLNLKPQFPEGMSTISDFDDILVCLSPYLLPNLENLSLQLDPRQLYCNTTQLGHYRKLKSLDLEINNSYTGYSVTKNKIFYDYCFIVGLLKSTSTLNTLVLYAQKPLLQELFYLVHRIELRNLKHLQLKTSLINYSSTSTDPQTDLILVAPKYPLTSFKLENTIATSSLTKFLRANENTLEELTIDFVNRCGSCTSHFPGKFDLMLPDIPNLRNIKKLHIYSFGSYFANRIIFDNLMKKTKFPKLEDITLKHNFMATYNGSVKLQFVEDAPITSYNYSQIKSLELYFEKKVQFAPFLRLFTNLKSLKLHCTHENFLKLLTPKKTVLSVSIQQLSLIVYNRDNIKSIPNWDSVLTGFEPNECLDILNHLRSNGYDDFDLDMYNINDWAQFKQVKEPPGNGKRTPPQPLSIAYFKNLQRFELSTNCVRTHYGCHGHASLRLTEVSLIYLLKACQNLTAINIHNSLIPKSFGSTLSSSLSPSFFLQLNGQ